MLTEGGGAGEEEEGRVLVASMRGEALVREASRVGLCAARVLKSCGMVGG
jgi:hypothetical protein